MKYYKWRLLIEGNFSLALVVLGLSSLLTTNEAVLLTTLILAFLIVFVGIFVNKKIKHDLFDEAAKEVEAQAMNTAFKITLMLIMVFIVYFFIERNTVSSNSYVLQSLYLLFGIVSGLPAVCYAYLERKILRQTKNESEE